MLLDFETTMLLAIVGVSTLLSIVTLMKTNIR